MQYCDCHMHMLFINLSFLVIMTAAMLLTGVIISAVVTVGVVVVTGMIITAFLWNSRRKTSE